MQVKTVQYGARRARRAQPRARRTGVRAGDAVGEQSSPRTASISAATSSRIRSTTNITATARRIWSKVDGAAVLGRQLGRPGPASARQFRRLRARRRRSRNGSKRTASSTGRISTPTTAASSRSASSTISCTARRTAGTSSRRCCCRSAIRARNSSSAPRTNGRSRARNGPSSISIRPMALGDDEAVRTSAAARPSTPWATASPSSPPPLAAGRPRSPARRRSSCSSRRRPAMPTSSSCCACSPPT